MILPFAFGTLGLMFIFQVDLIPAVFAGASMTATSIGITASVFGELGYLKTREGQIVIGAAVLDDILGIVILARITIPKISSSTAAPITICPSLVFKYPNSPKTLAVIPILVAVIDAPAKTAGIRSTWKININPRVPKANGKITPAGVILPFAFGTLGLMFIFQVDLIPAVFAGASMTATSIGITASVFGELGYLKTREGQIVIGAAVLDDILGIVILAVVVALARATTTARITIPKISSKTAAPITICPSLVFK